MLSPHFILKLVVNHLYPPIGYTSGPQYIDLAYLENTSYDEMIFNSRKFSPSFYSNLTSSMSNLVKKEMAILKRYLMPDMQFSMIFTTACVAVKICYANGRYIVCTNHCWRDILSFLTTDRGEKVLSL